MLWWSPQPRVSQVNFLIRKQQTDKTDKDSQSSEALKDVSGVKMARRVRWRGGFRRVAPME